MTTTNAAEFTVTEISQALKRAVEDQFGFVKVRGEISGYRGPHSSGHAYFALKDDGARMEAVIWRGVFSKLRFKPEEGMEVIATGKLTTFPGSSKYQIVIEALEPAGAGALMALLEERRKRLAAEGLFDPARKQLLPFLPTVIGVVTSPTGAVIRDILHRIADRFPLHVLVWPVRVQGEGSGEEVAAAIRGFNAGGPFPKPDVLIVARGGGSLEDLWGFNDEVVVRAAASSDIPLISAVGHETDWTLIDHAADVRAPTPTGAAEMAVPVRRELLDRVDDLHRRLNGAAARGLDLARTRLTSAARALPKPADILALPRQRFDAASLALGHALKSNTDAHARRFERVASRLSAGMLVRSQSVLRERLETLSARHQRAMTAHLRERRASLLNSASGLSAKTIIQGQTLARERLAGLVARGQRAMSASLRERANAVQRLTGILGVVSHRATLARGFALIRNADGQPVTGVASIAPGDRLDIEMADGHIAALAGSGSGGSSGPKPQKPKPVPADQGKLF